MKKALISLVMLTALVAFGATQVEAAPSDTIAVTVTITVGAASVSVTPESWEITESGETQIFTANNDSTNYTEALTIKCSDGSTWSIGPTAGNNIFVMTATGGDLSATPLTTADQTLETDVPAGGTFDFTLEFTAPTSVSIGTDSMTVTISAS